MIENQGHVPPQNQVAEMNLLGAMMLSSDVVGRVMQVMKTPEPFYRAAHQTIYDAIRELFEKSEPIDLTTVTNVLERQGKLEEVGGMLRLADILNSVATVSNAEFYAKIVEDMALLRGLIRAGHDIVASGYAEEAEPEAAIDDAERAIYDLRGNKVGDVVHIEKGLHKTFEELEIRALRQGAVTGTTTGFYDLDNLTSGFQPGNLIILGARPAVGKTSFAMTLARNCAAGDPRLGIPGKPVLVFSLEMSRDELIMRMLCSEARVDGRRIKTGMVLDDDWPKLGQAIGRLADMPIYIDDTSTLSVMDARSKCRRLASEIKEDLGLVVVDYLQLMEAGGGKKSRTIDSRAVEVSIISRMLKALAKELKVPVLALAQLARAVEQTKDKKPMLSHLRESGSLEQDADIVMFIHRDDYYNEESELKNQAEIIIAKHRNGPTGVVNLYFHKEFTLFDNLTYSAGVAG